MKEKSKFVVIKHRLLGAVFLIALAVILLPEILDEPRLYWYEELRGLPNRPAAPAQDSLSELSLVQQDRTSGRIGTLDNFNGVEAEQPAQSAWNLYLGKFPEKEALKWLETLHNQGIKAYSKAIEGENGWQVVFVGPELEQLPLQDLQNIIATEFGLVGQMLPFEPTRLSEWTHID